MIIFLIDQMGEMSGLGKKVNVWYFQTTMNAVNDPN